LGPGKIDVRIIFDTRNLQNKLIGSMIDYLAEEVADLLLVQREAQDAETEPSSTIAAGKCTPHYSKPTNGISIFKDSLR